MCIGPCNMRPAIPHAAMSLFRCATFADSRILLLCCEVEMRTLFSVHLHDLVCCRLASDTFNILLDVDHISCA